MTFARRPLVVAVSLVIALALVAVERPRADGQAAAGPDASTSLSRDGILLLAHGGSAEWDAEVRRVLEAVRVHHPAEVAFGMATRATIQAAITALEAQGVERIVAVPLFVSSHSSVIRATEYLLGLRDTAPPQLALFASMSHGEGGMTHGASGAAGDDAHAAHGGADGTTPVVTTLRIQMTPALDQHPIVGEILRSRADAMSRSPEREAIIVVAHGPSAADDNARWLSDMAVLARQVESGGFGRVEYLTVRDDGDPSVKEAATTELRDLVTGVRDAGLEPLIVPLLLSYGGIEEGIRERLEGLDYRMADQALLPDERIAQWVLAVASS